MLSRLSNGTSSAHIDLTGGTSDSSSDGASSSPRAPPTLTQRRHPTSPAYESEDEDYINGILLAPATGREDADEDMSDSSPGRKQTAKDSDDNFGPAASDAESRSSTPPWDRTGPSLHKPASRREAKARSETPPWDRTGPSLHKAVSKGRAQGNNETPLWDRKGPSLHRPTRRAKTKSETPLLGKTGPSLYKKKGKAVDDGIDWGSDRLAVVIDTPKSWFEQQARARKAAGVKVAVEGSVKRKPAPRRIVEVVIPVPRKRAAPRGKQPAPKPVSDVYSDISLGDIISGSAKKSKPTPKPARRAISVRAPTSSDDDDEPVFRRKTPKKVLTKKRPRSAERQPKKRRERARRDSDSGSWTEDDDGAAQIALDEPERFKTATRLRETGKSTFQAKLKALGRLRDEREKGTQYSSLPVELPTSSESGSGSGSDDDSGPSDFIVDDGPGGGAVELPEEFTVQKQPWQYKFKVAFQYLVLLVVRGEAVLPLAPKDAKYFERPVREVRSLFTGIRNSVAGQVWPAKYRKSLEKYPVFSFDKLRKPREYCSACARSKQRCFKETYLGGKAYRRSTHRTIHVSSDSYSSSSEDDCELGYLGNVCFLRTQYFHEVAHWEHTLFLRIRNRYHDLLRAKGKQHTIESSSDSLRSDTDDSDADRAARTLARARSEKRIQTLQREQLPRNVRDPNEVTEWLDRSGFQKAQLNYLISLETRGKELERSLLK